MKVGYATLYDDGELVISQSHTILSKKIYKDYGEFEDTSVPWKNESKNINNVKILDQVKSNCMKEWFDDCTNLTSLIDFKNLDVSDCADFSKMFWNCTSLQNISALEDWDVSNGIDFSCMFYYCRSLQDISALDSWNVSNGKYFSSMFRYCTSLQNISLPNSLRCLDENMFKDCNPNLKIRWKQYLYTYADLLEYKKIY